MRYALLLAAVLLGGCSTMKGTAEPTPESAAQPAEAPGAPQVERVPFYVGVSSATVQNLAKEQACVSTQGAGLVTEPGPVEVYRVQCDNGKVFMARCELRQCRKM